MGNDPSGTAAPENRLLAGELSFQLDRPCPRCGERTLMGYYFLTPADGYDEDGSWLPL